MMQAPIRERANQMIEIRHRVGSTLGLAAVSLLFVAVLLGVMLDGSGDIEMRPMHAFIGLAFGAGGAAVMLAYVTPRAAILTGLATAAVVGAMFASPNLVLPLVGVLLFGVGGILAVGQRLTRPVAMRLDAHGVTWQPSALGTAVTAPWAAVHGFVHERMHSNNVVVVLGDADRVTGLETSPGFREGVLAWVVIGQDRETVASFVDKANAMLEHRSG